eukprot:15367195-Ditylum_brightwellii.AAC.3
MFSTTNSHFASWIKVLLHHPSTTPFNNYTKKKIHAIHEAANKTEATNLLKGSQANLAFLTMATGVKHQCLLYHHLEEFESAILNQQKGHYALLSFGDSTQPVIVHTDILFNGKDKSVPGLDYLKDIDNQTKLDANPPTIGMCVILQTEIAFHSTILLPPWITKELKVAEVTMFSEIFLLIQEKAHDQDRLVDVEQDGEDFTPSTSHREDVFHILQPLWYWNYAANL